jgi:hypothetical protein
MDALRGRRSAIALDQVNRPKFLDWHRADMRNDIKPDDLPIALKGFGANTQAGPVPIPTLGKFGDCCL